MLFELISQKHPSQKAERVRTEEAVLINFSKKDFPGKCAVNAQPCRKGAQNRRDGHESGTEAWISMERTVSFLLDPKKVSDFQPSLSKSIAMV